MTKPKKSIKLDPEIVKLATTLSLMDEKLDSLNQVVLGNGTPDKGLVVTIVRMEQKMDAFLTHMEDKTIHRTVWQSIQGALKASIVLVPALLSAIFLVNLSLLILFPERSEALEALQAWLANLLGLGG